MTRKQLSAYMRRLGRKGGLRRTPAKATAARRNGLKARSVVPDVHRHD